MSSKLKKWIIAVVVFLLVGIGTLVAVTMLSGLSTSTVYALSLVEQVGSGEEEQFKEIISKEVYLKSQTSTNQEEGNFFMVQVKYSASSFLNFSVASSDNDVAKVEAVEQDKFKITYLKAGVTRITAFPTEGGNVNDSFVLTVREDVPTKFSIDKTGENEDNQFIIGENQLSIFGDGNEYSFKFDATRGDKDSNLNIDSIYVLDDYNKDVFEDVFIRSDTKQLVVKARQRENDVDSQPINIQVRYGGEKGVVVKNWTIVVDVRGYYIANIQLVISETPSFDGILNIYGEGIKNEGEREISQVYFSRIAPKVYAKVRLVYTNNQMEYAPVGNVSFDVDQSHTVATHYSIENFQNFGNFMEITIDGYAEFNFNYDRFTVRMTFNYLDIDEIRENSLYEYFYNKLLYRKIIDPNLNISYFEYIYWDSRYVRTDTVCDDEGRIVGFNNGDPDCEVRRLELVTPPSEEGEE